MPQNFHIIIADDDSDDRLIISEAIRDYSNSITISEVSNGKELIDFVHECTSKRVKPDAIILDINMPFMDGTEALKELKVSGLADEIPVFVLSTMRDKGRVDEALALGVSSAHAKPGSMKEFHEIVGEICTRSLLGKG